MRAIQAERVAEADKQEMEAATQAITTDEEGKKFLASVRSSAKAKAGSFFTEAAEKANAAASKAKELEDKAKGIADSDAKAKTDAQKAQSSMRMWKTWMDAQVPKNS